MKATLAVLAMLVAMSQAQAQSIQYDEATNTVVETKAAPAAPVVVSAPAVTVVQPAAAPVAAPAPAPTASSQSSAAITVVTPAAPVVAAPSAQSLGIQPQVVVQEQPTTVIEDQPVKDSRSELLHKARGQMEDHTEKKIVEKLEEARIRDEKKRSDRFDQAIDSSEQPVLVAPVAPVAPVGVPPQALQPEVVAPVAPVIVAPNAQAVVIPAAPAKEEVKEVKVEKKEVEEVKIDSNENVKPVVREELRSDMSAREEKKEERGQAYLGAVGGIADYPGATNLKANGMGGFNVGYITKNRIVIEGGFAYSSFDLQQNYGLYSQYPPYKDLSQYNMTLALKYQILPGMFRPYAGVLAGYTKRSYSNPTSFNYAYGTNQDASSDAIDYGFTVGVDVAVTSNLLIGADFRYMTNLSNHVDSAYQQSYQAAQYSSTTPVEELDYYSVGVSAKLLF